MKLSHRYVPHLIAILAVALVPIAAHSYLDVRTDDCADPLRLAPSSERRLGEESRNLFMQKRFQAVQWKEGRVPGQPPLAYTIIRSYDAKRVYYMPDLNLNNLVAADEIWRDELTVGADRIPIRRVRYEAEPGSGAAGVGAYLLVYNGEPVDNAYTNQLLYAPLRVFTGRLPMTLFYVSSRAPLNRVEEAEARQAEWLTGAWQNYRDVCFPR